MNTSTCVLTLALLSISLPGPSVAANTSDEKFQSEEQALETVLTKWRHAWNKSDAGALLELHHPESRWRKRFDADEDARKKFVEEFGELVGSLGNIDSWKIGKYIERKKRRVVKIRYEKKGTIPGTFALKRSNGVWMIDDFNIDGQGEPELTQ